MKDNKKQYIIYLIFTKNQYGELYLSYLGRTSQPLINRLRDHMNNHGLAKKLNVNIIDSIKYAICDTQADMYLYEIYYINLWKPLLNSDDKAKDNLTISIDELEWIDYWNPLLDKWKDKDR